MCEDHRERKETFFQNRFSAQKRLETIPRPDKTNYLYLLTKHFPKRFYLNLLTVRRYLISILRSETIQNFARSGYWTIEVLSK